MIVYVYCLRLAYVTSVLFSPKNWVKRMGWCKAIFISYPTAVDVEVVLRLGLGFDKKMMTLREKLIFN